MPNLQDSARNDYARTILSSGQALLILLNDILDLSKIEAGKFQLESTTFSPEALLHEISNLFAGAAQAKGLHLGGQWLSASGKRYLADSNRLRQMLSNLVGNALKFTHRGQVRIEAVELDGTDEVSVLEFSVSDTGIGIPADKLNLLFKPFSQTDSSTTREFGGTGLGLSIVFNLAKAMGGAVGVSSEPGQGSRFWFRVQVRSMEHALSSRQFERESAEIRVADIPPLRGHVMAAEDNPINGLVIQSLLGKLGLRVTLVQDGQQAVEAIESVDPNSSTERPDLILMDLHMPVMDGYTATECIRQWEALNKRQRIPIIALTADAFEEDRQRCMAVGMDDFLTKPIAIETLKIALTKWLSAPMESLEARLVSLEPFKPVDLSAFTVLVSDISPLLEKHKFDVFSHFQSLKTLVSGTEMAQEIDAIEVELKLFHFDFVLERLRQLVIDQIKKMQK
jgi:CheY-like chemotaxis protein/anti-sigma regulatory factor (Ser/Thr protein kinase)